MSGKIIPIILGIGQGFPGIGPPHNFWPFVAGLRTVVVLVGVPLHTWDEGLFLFVPYPWHTEQGG